MAVDGAEVPDKARYIRRRFSVITVVRQFSRFSDLLYVKETE